VEEGINLRFSDGQEWWNKGATKQQIDYIDI